MLIMYQAPFQVFTYLTHLILKLMLDDEKIEPQRG